MFWLYKSRFFVVGITFLFTKSTENNIFAYPTYIVSRCVGYFKKNLNPYFASGTCRLLVIVIFRAILLVNTIYFYYTQILFEYSLTYFLRFVIAAPCYIDHGPACVILHGDIFLVFCLLKYNLCLWFELNKRLKFKALKTYIVSNRI